MTPLANFVLKNIKNNMHPLRSSNIYLRTVYSEFNNLHCFLLDKNIMDLVFAMMLDLAKKLKKTNNPWHDYFSTLPPEAQFLPFERCWLEIGNVGFLAHEASSGTPPNNIEKFANVSWVYRTGNNTFASSFLNPNLKPATTLPLSGVMFNDLCNGGQPPIIEGLKDFIKTETDSFFTILFYQLLALINTPKLFDVKTTQPHKNLLRQANKGNLLEGYKFNIDRCINLHPVQATELKKSNDTYTKLDAKKRLHFVRAHLRNLPTKKITFVKSHYRGCPNIGVVNAIYNVKK